MSALFPNGETKMTETATATAAKTKKQTTITTVTMDDGRTVDFPGKRRMDKTSIITPDGKLQIRIDYVNGETRLFSLPDSLVSKFALHGAEQKLGDEIAGLDDIDDAVLAVDELIERLERGEWAVRREASGLAGTSVLARALVELSGKSASVIKTFLAGKSQAEKLALRADDKVAPIIARLEKEKVSKASTVNTSALLGELDGASEAEEAMV
jgi:hypothetical protein